MSRLLAAARDIAAVVRGPRGAERYALYFAAFRTGFRAKELSSLVPESFSLDSPPTAFLKASATKNGNPAEQPLPADLVAALRTFLAGRPAGVPVWSGNWWKRPADVIRPDPEAAGIRYVVEGRGGPEFCDFHSTRVTFITSSPARTSPQPWRWSWPDTAT